MDDIVDFIPLVRRELAPFLDRHGMRERQRGDSPAHRHVTFIGKGAFVRFSLDVRDGYLDVGYGDASNLDVYGNVDWSLPPPAWKGTVDALLKTDGVVIPPDKDTLYLPGRLVEAVREMVACLGRHKSRVFGRGVRP